MGTSWTANLALTSGHNYRVWVTAVGENGVTVQSAYKNFSVNLAVPVEIGPVVSVNSMRPTFSWSGVAMGRDL